GAAQRGDALYEAVSEGRRYPGMEHWLPLFVPDMETLFDHVPGASVVLDHLAGDALAQRVAQAADYYEARKETREEEQGGVPYNPLPPERLYLSSGEFDARAAANGLARIFPFEAETADGKSVDTAGRPGRNFAPERADENANVF